jgi:hypothetical protein
MVSPCFAVDTILHLRFLAYMYSFVIQLLMERFPRLWFFWDIMLCSLVCGFWCMRETCCFHFQDWRVKQYFKAYNYRPFIYVYKRGLCCFFEISVGCCYCCVWVLTLISVFIHCTYLWLKYALILLLAFGLISCVIYMHQK